MKSVNYIEGPLLTEITNKIIKDTYINTIEKQIYDLIIDAQMHGCYSVTLDKSYRKYYKLIKHTFKNELCYKVTREADMYCMGKKIYTGEIVIEWNKSIYRRLKLKWKKMKKR